MRNGAYACVLALLLVACSDSTETKSDAATNQPDLELTQDTSVVSDRGADRGLDQGSDQVVCTPTGAEVCDGLDNDCEGVVDDGLDCLHWGGSGADGSETIDEAFDLSTTLREGSTGPLGASHVVTGIDDRVLSGAAKETGVPEVTGIAAGDEVLLYNLRGSPSDHAAVGAAETAFVERVENNTEADSFAVTLRTPPTKVYGNGGDNTDLAGQHVVMIRVPHFDTLTIESGGTLTTATFNVESTGTGVIFFRAKSLIVQAGGTIDGAYHGYRGSRPAANSTQGRTGESLGGWPEASRADPPVFPAPNVGAGVGGRTACGPYDCTPQQTTGPAGGGASYATVGTRGQDNGDAPDTFEGGAPGVTYGDAMLSKLFLGSGGGGGGGGFSGPGAFGSGGNGGALIVALTDVASIEGVVSADGQIGSLNSNCNRRGSGGGGAGSGGTIWVSAATLTLGSSVLTAVGGPAQCNGGGIGGDGRIRIDFATLNGGALNSAAAVAAARDAATPDPAHLAHRQ